MPKREEDMNNFTKYFQAKAQTYHTALKATLHPETRMQILEQIAFFEGETTREEEMENVGMDMSPSTYWLERLRKKT